nr:hypothetical protein [Achromobacter sp. DMS1]
MKLLQSILLVALLCFSKAGFAVICLKEGGLSKDSVDIRTTIAVPNDEARGTVLWRSPNYHMRVECKQEKSISLGEKVFIYLSPTDQGMTQLGPDIEFGVNLKGVDYTCSSLERCRMEIGETEPCALLCTNFKTRFSIAYNFFIAKKSTPEQSAHKEGHHDLLAGRERRIGGMHHRTRQVDAADARILADDAAAPGLRQRVLVVQARIGDLDKRIARGQLVRRQRVVTALRRIARRAGVQAVGPEFGSFHACLR